MKSDMTSVRRTLLGLAYAGAVAVDWSATRGEGVHAITADGAIRLFDLTRCERFGLKGRGAAAWLHGQGLDVPARINTAVASAGRALDVMRLGQEDIVVLSRPGAVSGSPSEVRAAWEADSTARKGFDGWREEVWAWFHLCGAEAAELMAMTCPVDLRPHVFAQGNVAQTRVAQMDCVVLRSDRSGALGYDLFFDVASSAFALASFKELGAGS